MEVPLKKTAPMCKSLLDRFEVGGVSRTLKGMGRCDSKWSSNG